MGLPEEPSNGKRRTDAKSDGSKIDSGWLDQPSDEFQDHRRRGQYWSRYTRGAWTQIALEFSYLLLLSLMAGGALASIGYVASQPSGTPQSYMFFEYPRDRSFLLWISVGLSGVLGGTSFALKWLYHSVAKWTWNTDRILWRLIVPFLSGTLSVFVALMIASGIVSVFNSEFFSSFPGAMGGGFFIGYFSDNVLASLQNRAADWFGTVDRDEDGQEVSHGAKSN